MRYPEIRTLASLLCYKSDGTAVPAVQDPVQGASVTLGIATYLFPLGGERYGSVVETAMHAISARWPNGIVGTLTIEGTCFPKSVTSADQGQPDVTDWDITTDAWVQLNPALSGMTYANAIGSGTMTVMSCAIAATGIGGAIWNLPDFGGLRLRVKAVISTGGVIRVMGHSKLGS